MYINYKKEKFSRKTKRNSMSPIATSHTFSTLDIILSDIWSISFLHFWERLLIRSSSLVYQYSQIELIVWYGPLYKRLSNPHSFFFWSVFIVFSCQFHQHFTCAFFANFLAPKNYKVKRFSFVILGAKILAINARVKCWWNWHLL